MPNSGLNMGYQTGVALTDSLSPAWVKKQKHIKSSRTLEDAKKSIPGKGQTPAGPGAENVNALATNANMIGNLIDTSHLNDRTIHILQTMQPHINLKKQTQFRVSNLQTCK